MIQRLHDGDGACTRLRQYGGGDVSAVVERPVGGQVGELHGVMPRPIDILVPKHLIRWGGEGGPDSG